MCHRDELGCTGVRTPEMAAETKLSRPAAPHHVGLRSLAGLCFDLTRGSTWTPMTAGTNFECCKTLKLESHSIKPSVSFVDSCSNVTLDAATTWRY